MASIYEFAVVVVALTTFLAGYQCVDEASFYGNSFISVPLKEAKDSTDITFKFRTHLPNALILLVTGSTDYCIVRLDNARIKLSINLGSGEFEVASPRNLKLNDFKWHDLVINRREANLSLIIDNQHTVKKHLPGKFFELNIHYGLFVGGHGNYSDIFFGHVENYRGCLADLRYNGLDVLQQARRRQTQSVVNAITWNCAAEFDANEAQPISFINDDAFMTITRPTNNNNNNNLHMKIDFELKTLAQDGVLVYTMGTYPRFDALVLDLTNGRIRLTLKIANKITDLVSEVTIADGEWHSLFVHVKTLAVDWRIDSWTKTAKLTQSGHLDTGDVIYIGGIEWTKRTRTTPKGIKMAEISYKGCMRHLRIADQAIALRDVRVSEGLLSGCLWQFPCLANPCAANKTCIAEGLDAYHCTCLADDCAPSNGSDVTNRVVSRMGLAMDLELLRLEALEVLEGGTNLITTTNLHMILDYFKYGITETGIIFRNTEQPEHGHVVIDVWPHEKNSFTLLDVSKDKIHYVHDGSESRHDTIVFDVEFTAFETFTLPSYLQGKFKFALGVNVLPVNDPPELHIPTTTVLRLARGNRKIIGANLIQTIDPDNATQHLIYSVVDSGNGHLEHLNRPGVRVQSFSRVEVEENKIVFVHNKSAANESYIALKVSDGITTSAIAKLRVFAFPQFWRLQNNTGLKLVHKTAAIITPLNLSFVSNVPDSVNNAKYYIVQGPQFGSIELEIAVDTWEKVENFDSDDLLHHRVRYRHTAFQPDFDEFQFYTSLNTSAYYTFRITFTKCHLVQLASASVNLDSSKLDIVINATHLHFQTDPIPAPTTSIFYTLAAVPNYGLLLSSLTKYRLRAHDVFTQEDLASGNIKYKLFRKAYSTVADRIAYVVSGPGCANVSGTIAIEYVPAAELRTHINVTLERLEIDEGGREPIGPMHCNIASDLFTQLTFNLTHMPQHGYLRVDRNDSIRNRTDYFTLDELRAQQLFYVHDDSESTADSFVFVALSDENENFEYVGRFTIKIRLKNDNMPVRAIDQVFHVVTGGKKLLTNKDLSYIDRDIDTLPSAIIYTCRESSNGHLYLTQNATVKLTQFTQADLDGGAVLFKHDGAEYGKLKLWITDGQFYVNGILDVHASAPFVRTLYNEKLIVRKGGSTVLTAHHLSVLTNLFATDQQIKYEIVTKPNYGQLAFVNSSESIVKFTQDDINNGRIRYIHVENASSADEMSLRIRCRDVIAAVQLNVWILPASYWDPLVVKTSHTLLVEESTSAIISRNILEISQIDVPASAITYHVSELPQNGYLSILSITRNHDDQLANVRTFTQALINENRLLYIQSGANETKDSIVFNVTNGMVSLHGLTLDITIIPEHLFLTSRNLTVREGEMVTITAQHLIVLTEYYKFRITDYIIVEKPHHGCIKIHKKCNKLNGFTNKELLANIVEYAQDGSEQSRDNIVLIAVAGSKRSYPIVVHVHILPVNNHSPRVVNNTGVVMWEGGTTLITNNLLATIDDDQPPEILFYHILGYWWGNLSLASNTRTTLNTFTQQDIDQNLIVFHHQSGKEAKFTFNVTDGLHATGEQSFHIKTKPVALQLLTQSRLHVFPLQRKPISTDHLLATISDTNRTITYQIEVPPSLGRLILYADDSGISRVTNRFTQNDINNSRIYYEHTHPFADLYASDAFTFNAHAHLAKTLPSQQFKIDISVSSGELDAYVKFQTVTVDEGGTVAINANLSGVVLFLETHAALKAPIIHATAHAPQHGRVFLKDSNVTTFTQQDLEAGRIHYQHDHSDTLNDSIRFALYLLPGYIALCNVSIPVSVNPLNDQPFTLITPAPHFAVVQGENHTITDDELATEDADTVAADLRYDIISGPSEGQLMLAPDGLSINHFSQEDVDRGKLIYAHRGFGLNDAFHLRVWDGKFRPEYTVLNVRVTALFVNVSMGVPVYIQQGSNVALITHKQLTIATNGNVAKIECVVREAAQCGVLYVRDAPAHRFTYGDLLAGNVMYMQTDMTASNDSVRVFAGISVGNASVGDDVDIRVQIQALMQIKNFTAYAGKRNRLTVRTLDATALAKLTSSNPTYTITHAPHYGDVRKIIRSSGERRNVLDAAVKSFTHEEIESGLIYLVVKEMEVQWHGVEDRLGFRLAATIFQPAQAELKIIVQSSLYNELHSTPVGPSDPAGHEGGMHMASPNMTRDYFLIVSMVVGVIILGIAVIVTIKCRTFEPEGLRKAEGLQPIPLPRPPDRIMVTPSSQKKDHDHEGCVSSIPTTLPHCKVTPLNDAQTRYPYGMDEHVDDWSSCDASDPSCPNRNNIMLRRNQYWV